ncbi:MAG: archease, partial [Anaerolineales bacterium]|nr:archease [Anaerolineales bacterium]
PAPGPAESDTGQRSPLRRLILTAPDVEALLVAFLSEMLYLVEQEHITLDNLQVSLFPGEALWRLEAVGEARPLARVQKLIKAVTYYNLHIRSDEDGYSVEVVFDV